MSLILMESSMPDASSSYTPQSFDRIPIILFGMVGSGKSTIAQMLTHGDLTTDSQIRTGNSLQGTTTKVDVYEGRKWTVIDTPGLGTSEDRLLSTVKTMKQVSKCASRSLTKHSTCLLYVMRNVRVTTDDVHIWEMFHTLFSKSGAFAVVITNRRQDVTSEERKYLERVFSECKEIFCVDFISAHNNLELEEVYKKIRKESLQCIETKLEQLSITSTFNSSSSSSYNEFVRIRKRDIIALFVLPQVVSVASKVVSKVTKVIDKFMHP